MLNLVLSDLVLTTAAASVPEILPPVLDNAGCFAVLAKSGISTVPTSKVTGDIGVSPIASSAITGFSLVLDSSSEFSEDTSAQLDGQAYATNYLGATPGIMTTTVSSMETAYTDVAGRTADVTEFGSDLISGMTLTAGVYKWTTDVNFANNITIQGNAKDIFIFQTSGNVIAGSGAKVTLVSDSDDKGNKPLASNILWQVAGFVDAGTTSHLEGTFLVATAVTMKTHSSLNGRILAQTTVNLQMATITCDACAAACGN